MSRPSSGQRGHGCDPLSDLLKTVRLTGAVFFEIAAEEPWAVGSPPRELILPKILPGADHLIAYHPIAMPLVKIHHLITVKSITCDADRKRPQFSRPRVRAMSAQLAVGAFWHLSATKPTATAESRLGILFGEVGRESSGSRVGWLDRP
jgi:hypothetical protein